jgi:hypothetical protein
MLEYLKLFGYKPDRTIMQVHIAGFFNKKRTGGRQAERKAAAAKKYGGTTFVVVGRTHDPSIMEQVSKPKKKPEDASPGYVGYLWKDKDPQSRAPHEAIPFDFTPAHLAYPQDWKNMFATKGFMRWRCTSRRRLQSTRAGSQGHCTASARQPTSNSLGIS